MKLAEFDYYLPRELIAQTPVEPRDHSRLMVVNRDIGEIKHDVFFNLPKYLKRDDLLVFNQTKVFPARLYGHKETGGQVEILLLKPGWEFIGKNIGRAKRILFDRGLEGSITSDGLMKFNKDNDQLMKLLKVIGHTPLPPYIAPSRLNAEPKIRQRYQTVYAREIGSAAAPTAGFHFTKQLLEKIPNKAFVTLHVGLGTFAPVKTEIIEEHKMHSEIFNISPEAKYQIQDARNNKRRIVAVGTTSVRVLESDWSVPETSIFIYPGYKFKFVGAMITNFHLPKSTLLMLVSAFAGRDLIRKAYEEAVREKYRFFSFGDAMLIV